MAERAKKAYEAWKLADAEARAAEARLKAAWEEYDANHRAPPTAELMADVSRLRAAANDKLTMAMLMMGSASKAADDTAPGSPK